MIGGAKGSRTPDLLNAIQALSQLSYGPTEVPPFPATRCGLGASPAKIKQKITRAHKFPHTARPQRARAAANENGHP